MKLENIINEQTKFVNEFYAEPLVRNLQVDDVLQFERRGYYRVDKVKSTKSGDKVIDLIFTPDGRTKAMTSYQTTAVKAEDLTKGSGAVKTDKKKELKNNQKQQAKSQVEFALVAQAGIDSTLI